MGSWCCLVSSLGFGDVFRFGACNLSVGFRAAVVIRLRLFSLGLLYDDSNDDEDEAGDDDEEDHEDSRFGLVGSKGVGFPKPRLQSSGGGGGVGGGVVRFSVKDDHWESRGNFIFMSRGVPAQDLRLPFWCSGVRCLASCVPGDASSGF